MKKCKWCIDKECEIKCMLSVDDEYCSCSGTKADMWWCNVIANNAEYDNVPIEEVIKNWYGEEEEIIII